MCCPARQKEFCLFIVSLRDQKNKEMIPTQQDIAEFTRFQRNEITESILYERLASIEKDENNRKTLRLIAAEEKSHYAILKKYTGKEIGPDYKRIARFYFLARILGITFAIKLMESSEENAHNNYDKYAHIPDLQRLAHEEEVHEQKLISLINEERLEYMGSVVLGLNDALVEFTGALAGFTLALSDSKLIALTGSITGIAAALSMASSEYLSTKSEGDDKKHPVKAAVYTGIAYLITVVSLVYTDQQCNRSFGSDADHGTYHHCPFQLLLFRSPWRKLPKAVYGNGCTQFQCGRYQFPDRIRSKDIYRNRCLKSIKHPTSLKVR